MSRFLVDVRGERSRQRVEAICGAMLDEFGGLEGFVAAWSDFYRRVFERGGVDAIRCFEAYFRLVRYCDAQQRRRPSMADDEREGAYPD